MSRIAKLLTARALVLRAGQLLLRRLLEEAGELQQGLVPEDARELLGKLGSPLKGSIKGDMDIGIDLDVDIIIHIFSSEASCNWAYKDSFMAGIRLSWYRGIG